ncbi:hypothetical protein T484DRAFT_1979919, partial [Baffinella frigidus]
MPSLTLSLFCVLAAAVGAAGATGGRADVAWRGAALVRSLRLRGGAPVVLFTGGDSDEMIPNTNMCTKEVEDPLLDPPGGLGFMTSMEADRLRALGALRGRWDIESQEEPESDIQDAFETEWPEDWGGEEEHQLRHAPGPVRLYSATKYNHDILPTGRFSAETMNRVGHKFADDGDFTAANNARVARAVRNAQRAKATPEGESSDVAEKIEQHMAGLMDHTKVTAGGSGLTGGQGLSFLPDVTEAQAAEWLKEAEKPWTGREEMSKVPLATKHEAVKIDLDTDGKPRTKAMQQAEVNLDKAIRANDEDAVEAAIAAMQ